MQSPTSSPALHPLAAPAAPCPPSTSGAARASRWCLNKSQHQINKALAASREPAILNQKQQVHSGKVDYANPKSYVLRCRPHPHQTTAVQNVPLNKHHSIHTYRHVPCWPPVNEKRIWPVWRALTQKKANTDSSMASKSHMIHLPETWRNITTPLLFRTRMPVLRWGSSISCRGLLFGCTRLRKPQGDKRYHLFRRAAWRCGCEPTNGRCIAGLAPAILDVTGGACRPTDVDCWGPVGQQNHLRASRRSCRPTDVGRRAVGQQTSVKRQPTASPKALVPPRPRGQSSENARRYPQPPGGAVTK